MKIVSDFDGVLTDISAEAERVGELFVQYLGEYSLIPKPELTQILQNISTKMENAPFSFGWFWEGRISAFHNEDGFVRTNAIAAALDEEAKRGHQSLSKAKTLLGHFGFNQYIDLAQKAYQDMTAETAKGKHHPIEKGAVDALGKLISQGASVVVVSNSKTERIFQLLSSNGLAPSNDPKARLRVRGDAGKFRLGTSPRPISFDTFHIDTDRPQYEKILLEEAPDHVLGDVFSLDLALPLYLRRQGASELSNNKVWLRRRSYTPSWSLRLFSFNSPTIKESEGGTFENFDALMASPFFR